MKEYTYGFQVKQVNILINKFDIYDLAENKKIFNFRYSGFLKPKAKINDLDKNTVLEIKKKSIFGSSWEVSKLEDIEIKKESVVSFSEETIKKGVKIVDFNKKGGLCSREYSINTKEGNYLALKYNLETHMIMDSTGKEVVRLSRTKGTILITYLVEVDESFEPLIALGVSVILIYLYISAKK
ncbi:MAG: hypothetical protein H7641_11480, partial [Candidatus Heimdallarchaeota archaeon]|nr:hypothetical protein [Candidatus Heimdallarchaeota archaeon]MCK4878181.1 hypothetical protein [Candidatus Heimdallarchaeota archaeon]